MRSGSGSAACPVSFSARSFSAALRESFTRPLSSMPMHLTQMMSPIFDDVFGAFDAEIRQLGNVHQAVLARQHFDERAEFFHRDDAALIGLADLDFARHAADDFLRARHAFAGRGVDVHGAVVFDVNLSAGLSDDALDRSCRRGR